MDKEELIKSVVNELDYESWQPYREDEKDDRAIYLRDIRPVTNLRMSLLHKDLSAMDRLIMDYKAMLAAREGY